MCWNFAENTLDDPDTAVYIPTQLERQQLSYLIYLQ